MTSPATVTKSPTLPTLTEEQRARLTDFIANRYLDNMDGRDLEHFFYDIQMQYLGDYTDEELLGALEDVTNEDEYEEVLNEA